ncbi:MAG: monovalent cation/H+ antiporter subunit D family protein, partial [Anaerolineae bacterium]|nr:monovalent cation/H+ antiporter subunit D family protein [Anaerolineae bacterium]
MNWDDLLPLLLVLTSFVPGVVIFFLRESQISMRTFFNMAGALSKLVLIAVMVNGLVQGAHYETRLPFLPGIDLVLRADTLSLLFVILSASLWLLTTIYAIGYLEHAPHRSRFFGFFSL